jgi:hypothetical protein
MRAKWICVLALAASGGAATPDVAMLLERSNQALQTDWQSFPEYNYFEHDTEQHDNKTYHVFMIGGSPYQELIAVDGRNLSGSDREKAEEELTKTTQERARESEAQTEKRVADFKKDRERDHELFAQLTKALDFKLTGEETVGKYRTYVLQATPKPGYQPPDKKAEVLTGMQGTLWIDTQTYQWVKVEAEVVRPVSIEGFLARVEPGTRFELEKRPVTAEVWLPSHFAVRAKAEILDVFGHSVHMDETFSDYQKATSP